MDRVSITAGVGVVGSKDISSRCLQKSMTFCHLFISNITCIPMCRDQSLHEHTMYKHSTGSYNSALVGCGWTCCRGHTHVLHMYSVGEKVGTVLS